MSQIDFSIGGRALKLFCFAIVVLFLPALGCGAREVRPSATDRSDAGVPAQPTNGAVTAELSSTGISLDTVVADLDASGVATLCGAIGKWNFRLHPQACLAFVQSAIILQPRTEAEDRVLCSENLRICGPPPMEPTPACTDLPATCTVTLGEIDRCLAERERALLAIPSCENMTRALAPSTPGAPFDQPSCTKITTICSPAF